jgi:HEAT repeat protein
MQERIVAVIALGESGDPRAVRPLIDCCRDKNPELRWHAIVALGRIRSGRSVEALMERLRDPGEREENRERAAMALATIGSLSAITGLREVLTGEAEDSEIRSIVSGILGRAANQ